MQASNTRHEDLQDSDKDLQKLQPEHTTIDIPDVSDIPGQENIKPAPLGELADTTISSADEEGDAVFGDDGLEMSGNNSNVTEEEREDLDKSANSSSIPDDENLRRAALDNTDDDGTPLNEASFSDNISASDLDVPGASADDDNEDIGEEDEENNEYSLGGGKHD